MNNYYKPLLFAAGCMFFLIMTLIILTIGNSGTDNKAITESKTPTIEATEGIQETIIDKNTPKTVTSTPIPTRTVNFENAENRENVKNQLIDNEKGKLALVENYRKQFITAVNTNNKDALKYVILSTSPIYKESMSKIDKFVKEKTTLELKKIELIKVTEKNNVLTVETKENIGIKKDTAKIEYKDFNVTYTIKKNESGYIIESQKGGI